MAQSLCMLAVILAIVVLSSFVASLIPGRPVPEVVFFVFAGALVGPHCLDVVHTGDGLSLLSRIGLGLLFLMAGYELDPGELTGRMGREATVSWAASMAIALLVTPMLGLSLGRAGDMAFAIALTTTAYGTLVPIMRDRGLNGTPVGKVIESYGAMGEIWPVLAMSLLLVPGRSLGMSVVVLVGFFAVCALVARQGERTRALGTRLAQFLTENAEGESRPTLRATMLLLVSLLAPFAAGFVLGHVLPGDSPLERLIQTVGNGFLVPVFFVYSGLSIDLAAVGSDPALLLTYMGLLLLVRTLPMLASLSLFPDTRGMTLGERLSSSLYCTMALPLIVAITEAATRSGAMREEMASVLVTAGALTVLCIPVITTASRVLLTAHPFGAAREIARNPTDVAEIIHEHERARRAAARSFHEERHRRLRSAGQRLSSADWLANARSAGQRARDAATRRQRHPDDAREPGAGGRP